MGIHLRAGKRLAGMLIAALVCMCVLVAGTPAFAEAAKQATPSEPYSLADLYCSQTAKEALGREQLQELIDLIITSVEPQAVNLLIERFPCFKEAAAKDELGKEIGLYIFYGTGDPDGIDEHENVPTGAYAAVVGGQTYEEDRGVFKYMISIDAQSLCTVDEKGHAVLDLNDSTRAQVDTTFCHELFHAFMEDYNRVGMSGYTDYSAFVHTPEEVLSLEEEDLLLRQTVFPGWFTEGLAGCVGNIYPADLPLFREYHYDLASQQYLDRCTEEQLKTMYANAGYLEGTGEELYDLEASLDEELCEQAVASTYVSGYMACLYLADLSCREEQGTGAVIFDEHMEIQSISSEKLREGISALLSRLHRGATLDEVIRDLSKGTYGNTMEFTERFIKGTYNEKTQEYDGDPGSLRFCVGYLNYMQRLDAADPNGHPAGSILLDDFASFRTTPLEKDAAAVSKFYRFAGKNTLVTSTVSNESVKDGGVSYSGRDSFETVLQKFRAETRELR